MPGMTTVDQALEGRIPDLEFNLNSGEVGATARLRVRGTSTLVGNREPLWVLDGFVLSDPVDVSADQLNDPDYINYIGHQPAGHRAYRRSEGCCRHSTLWYTRI